MMLDRHNLDRVRTRAKEAFPDLTLAQVEALPLAERKAAGVILPYKIATLPFPYGFEQSHVMLRSEEHTSELQSLMRISYAVFCLKKKNNDISSMKSISRHEYRG